MKPRKRKDFENASSVDVMFCDQCPDLHIIFYDAKQIPFAQAVLAEVDLVTLLKERGVMKREH